MSFKVFLKFVLTLTAFVTAAVVVANAMLVATVDEEIPQSGHYSDGLFHNAFEFESFSWSKLFAAVKRQQTEVVVDDKPSKPLPMVALDRAMLDAIPDDQLRLVKLGHSTVLIKAYGRYVLIDPMLSQRASPFSFFGPLRFQAPALTVEELPPIDTVLISHNHYDHLDKASVTALADKAQRFLVPLGVGGDLRRWGVDDTKITSMDWWQSHETTSGEFVFTPSQHFSGRGLSDRDRTLWGSWVLNFERERIYFSGDSGYFDGFQEIGDKYGPFDLTLLENGAYNPDWPYVHMFPEEAVQAHLDLRGGVMVPIHNSTFDLAFHAWYEPLDRVLAAAAEQQVVLSTPRAGELFGVREAAAMRWWLAYK